MMELVDEADLHAPHAGLLVVGKLGAIDAVDENLAAVGAFEKSRDMEQRRFARARRPEQRDGFAGRERGGGALQDVDAAIALGVGPLEPFKSKHRRHLVIHFRALLVTQRFDGIESRGPPGRIERGEDRQHERHDDDRRRFT